MQGHDPTHLDPTLRRGRGSLSNRKGRFEPYTREAVDDGWMPDQDLAPLRTEVRHETPRRIITRNTSPDLDFDRSVNAYRGCEHGCVYCFARPTHAFLGLSPGLDFETKLTAKPQAPARLRKELSAKTYRPAVLAMGTNTDPYQPIERTLKITRKCLSVLQAFQHPVAIVTKGTLIERDLDILGDMAGDGLARVGISVTTLDSRLARRLEPRAPSPARRLKAIEALASAGIDVRVMASPMIPGLTDHELEAILQAARDAGAIAASTITLRLPFEVAGLFREWLAEHAPDRAARVIARVRETHGGKDYDSEWGKRLAGQGEYALMMQQRFGVACKRLGLARNLPPLRTDLFHVPPQKGDQLSLF